MFMASPLYKEDYLQIFKCVAFWLNSFYNSITFYTFYA